MKETNVQELWKHSSHRLEQKQNVVHKDCLIWWEVNLSIKFELYGWAWCSERCLFCLPNMCACHISLPDFFVSNQDCKLYVHTAISNLLRPGQTIYTTSFLQRVDMTLRSNFYSIQNSVWKLFLKHQVLWLKCCEYTHQFSHICRNGGLTKQSLCGSACKRKLLT